MSGRSSSHTPSRERGAHRCGTCGAGRTRDEGGRPVTRPLLPICTVQEGLLTSLGDDRAAPQSGEPSGWVSRSQIRPCSAHQGQAPLPPTSFHQGSSGWHNFQPCPLSSPTRGPPRPTQAGVPTTPWCSALPTAPPPHLSIGSPHSLRLYPCSHGSQGSLAPPPLH